MSEVRLRRRAKPQARRVAPRKKRRQQQEQSILAMTSAEAREFLLKPQSYCSINFPPYFRFDRILSAVSKAIGHRSLCELWSRSPRNHEHVNYTLLSNKDGRHGWRPFQLIHPALYVSLVNNITSDVHWSTIQSRFSEFQSLNRFRCLSIPVHSRTRRKDQAAQILQWWQGVEQGSIELALDYMYVFHTDVADCYGAIYTHSIPWALHGKAAAKKHRNDKGLIGNIIDRHIQDMRHGQTNGIPQGSVVMDLIAEMVLGHADMELSRRLESDHVDEYLILRYRDDYRIFVNNPRIGERILKSLTEVMIELGLRLNAAKTTESQAVISSAVKADKLAWFRSRQEDSDLQKHLLLIFAHGLDYPNSGSLMGALDEFQRRIRGAKKIRNPRSLISIAVDIAYKSPRTFPICAAIISKVLDKLENDEERLISIRKIYRKLSQVPNTGHMEVWLQRISLPYTNAIPYREHLCRLVSGEELPIWDNDWISSKKLRLALDPMTIVDAQRLRSLAPVVHPAEINLFSFEIY